MKLTCYRIAGHDYLTEVDSDGFVEAWKRGDGTYCLDIQQCQPSELEHWLKSLNISELALGFLMNPRKIGAVIPLDDEVIFQFPVYSPGSGEEQSDNYVCLLCLKNLIISIYTDPISDADHFVNIMKSQLKLSGASTSALVSVLLARESFQIAEKMEQLRVSVFQLDAQMDRAPDSVEVDQILDKKSLLRVYEAVANGQALCFEQLRLLDTSVLSFVELSTYLQLATTNASAASQAATRLDKVIADLMQRFASNQQEKTNHRLAVLTILSAIFMPLTLLAGIYGMNFDIMPELHFSWSYPVVILSMLLIAGGMFHYFKSNGWLD